MPFFSAEIFKSFDMLSEQIVLRVAITAGYFEMIE